ncbi:MAG: hypothetical protein ACLFTI_09725 [Anaerolineales bacterium]
MSTIMIAVGIVLIILIIFMLYAVYRWSTQEGHGEDIPLTRDEKIGLEEAYKHEKEALESAEKWREKTHEVYHFQLVSREVLDTYIGDPTEEALKQNLRRAQEAIETHKERLEQLRIYAEQNNIDLEAAKENKENKETEGDGKEG